MQVPAGLCTIGTWVVAVCVVLPYAVFIQFFDIGDVVGPPFEGNIFCSSWSSVQHHIYVTMTSGQKEEQANNAVHPRFRPFNMPWSNNATPHHQHKGRTLWIHSQKKKHASSADPFYRQFTQKLRLLIFTWLVVFTALLMSVRGTLFIWPIHSIFSPYWNISSPIILHSQCATYDPPKYTKNYSKLWSKVIK